MAQLLAKEMKQISRVSLTQKVEANGIFALIPPEAIADLQKEHFFYIWNDKTNEIRLMCSFDTTENDVRNFAKKLKELTAN